MNTEIFRFQTQVRSLLLGSPNTFFLCDFLFFYSFLRNRKFSSKIGFLCKVGFVLPKVISSEFRMRRYREIKKGNFPVRYGKKSPSSLDELETKFTCNESRIYLILFYWNSEHFQVHESLATKSNEFASNLNPFSPRKYTFRTIQVHVPSLFCH